MLGKFGADGEEAASTKEVDARLLALALMSRALAVLDSDCNIPPLIGAHLQSAIDTLWTSVATNRSSNLHGYGSLSSLLDECPARPKEAYYCRIDARHQVGSQILNACHGWPFAAVLQAALIIGVRNRACRGRLVSV